MTPFSIALSQIQRPTWWVFEERKPRGCKTDPEVQERIKRVFEFVNSAGRRLTTEEVKDHISGITHQQALYSLKKLATEGKIKQIKPKRDMSYWLAMERN